MKDRGTLAAGMGSVLATVMSYDTNHSIPWAVVHFLLSWIYVIYHAINY
jgi:hypothetical protein